MQKFTLKRKSNGDEIITKGKNILKLKLKRNGLDHSDINIFNLGTLVHFETHSWRASLTLPKEISCRISQTSKSNWYRAVKDLINREHLTVLNSKITEARNLVYDTSLPFPITSVHFVPHDQVEPMDKRLKEIVQNLDNAKIGFRKNFADYIKEAKKILEPDGLFNPGDYPQDPATMFTIGWRFFNLAIPSMLTDEIKAQETKQFQNLMNEARDKGILALRRSFAEIVSDLSDTLIGKADGERKRMNQSKLDRVNEFLQTFNKLNVFNDSELRKLIENASEVTQGVSFEDLRKDKDLSGMIAQEMAVIKTQLDGMVETYERKVSFM